MSIRKGVDIIREKVAKKLKCAKKMHPQFPLYCKTQEETLTAVKKTSV
jgi:hypothetical protein